MHTQYPGFVQCTILLSLDFRSCFVPIRSKEVLESLDNLFGGKAVYVRDI